MTNLLSGESKRTRLVGEVGVAQISVEHYLRLLYHRKWLVLGVFLPISIGTLVFAYRLPNSYTSETVILVDPQKVPETYVKPTVTGAIHNRLGTLSQQILSATRLQKIIENFNLYPEERRKLAREDVIARMRSDIGPVSIVSNFGSAGSQDLQAFRISYTGKDPHLVAQVTNQLASLFIEENLKAREQQATGTTEFLQNQLQNTRRSLEELEAKLGAFKRRHVGELPEHQTASMQILGQLQAQLQTVNESLNRAEQQKTYLQSMMFQSAPVVDLDESAPRGPAGPQREVPGPPPRTTLNNARAQLEKLLTRYSEEHPDVRRARRVLEEEEKAAAVAPPMPAEPKPEELRPVETKRVPRRVVRTANPVLQAQLQAVDAEIVKHQEEQQRLTKLVGVYRSRLEAIPVREQEMADLVRDYEMSKVHYQQLLEKQLSAETATQLEIRQKGEKFTILDPAQVPERPSGPNRMMINAAGSLAGLGLGFLLAVATEFLGMSITSAEQLAAVTGLTVLEVVPVIQTRADRLMWKKRMTLAVACGFLIAVAAGAALFYNYRNSLF
jgi:polysaccharide chain length determinant protein (PEP-CTERM system associated)